MKNLSVTELNLWESSKSNLNTDITAKCTRFYNASKVSNATPDSWKYDTLRNIPDT